MNTLPENYYSLSRTEMLPFIPKDAKKILEIGCSEGLFAAQVKKIVKAQMWGIDINSRAAKSAGKVFDKVLIGDINTEIDNLPSGYFDCVIMNDILEHLLDPVLLLKALKQKCALKAKIVCSIPNVRYYKVLKDLILRKEWKYQEFGVLDRTHLRFFTRNSIIEMFEGLGCRIVKIQGINAIYSRKYALLNFFSFGFLADTIYLQFACVVEI